MKANENDVLAMTTPAVARRSVCSVRYSNRRLLTKLSKSPLVNAWVTVVPDP